MDGHRICQMWRNPFFLSNNIDKNTLGHDYGVYIIEYLLIILRL